MTHYVDVKIKPTAQMKANILLDEAYTKLHLALHSLNSSSIGVSFPEYELVLGETIRLHGTEESLKELMDSNWLGDSSFYSATAINNVPENCSSFVKTARIQPKMSKSKFNRLVKRGSISKDEAKKYKIKMLQSSINNPFVVLKSASNQNMYRRYFEISKAEEKIEGSFDHFGISKTASLPNF